MVVKLLVMTLGALLTGAHQNVNVFESTNCRGTGSDTRAGEPSGCTWTTTGSPSAKALRTFGLILSPVMRTAPAMATSGFAAQADAIEEALGVMVGAGFDIEWGR